VREVLDNGINISVQVIKRLVSSRVLYKLYVCSNSLTRLQ